MPANLPIVNYIGWNKPAIELIAAKLLELHQADPAEFARAILVVPTMENGRRLRMQMARQAGRPVLVPRIIQPGQLVEPGACARGMATRLDTEAAWLKVMLQVAGEVKEDASGRWFHLFPKAPIGDTASWAANMSRQLMHLRSQMEQECLTERYAGLIQGYYPEFAGRQDEKWQKFLAKMGARWNAVQDIFARVDQMVSAQGLATQESVYAAAVAQPQPRKRGGLVILACVPELSAQNELYLRNGIAAGAFRVLVLVNAPQEEACWFDDFGCPLTRTAGGQAVTRWTKDAICLGPDAHGQFCIPGGERFIHLVPDADAMGAKAVELAGGQKSAHVTVAACDTGMAPAVHTAFLRGGAAPWRLNMPGGRAVSATWEGQLPELLAAVLQAPRRRPLFNGQTGRVDNNEPNLLEPLTELLKNTALQRGYAATRQDTPDMGAFNSCLDDIMRCRYPAHPELLLASLRRKDSRGNPIPAAFHDYAREQCRLVQACSGPADSLAGALETLARWLEAAAGQDGSLLAPTLRETAGFIRGKGAAYGGEIMHALLRQELAGATRQVLPLMTREDTHGDLMGWKELSYCGNGHIIICGMHDDCVPERPRPDIFLPDALRCSVGATSSESRTARDSFLLTALLRSHPGQVDFIVARTRTDGAPPAPSSLLLRCGPNKEELARRAAYLFREDDTVREKKAYRHWNLLHAHAHSGLGNIRDFTLPDGTPAVNPFAAKDTFSPSFLNTFLTCPLRFWLKHVFQLDPADAYPEDLSELQGADYGTVLHNVLEDFVGKYPSLASLPEGDTAARLELLTTDIRARVEEAFKPYGGSARAIMQVQKEQMQAALTEYAQQHLATLEQGWRNVWREEAVAFPLALDDGSTVQIRVRLDRVDFHDDTGQWRIIDYKSHSTPPNGTHWGTLCVDDDPPPFADLLPDWVFETTCTTKTTGEEHSSLHHWKDVQLPLYAEALRALCAARGAVYAWPELGYYNIPRGQATAKFNPLPAPTHRYARGEKPAFTPEFHALAMRCAKSAITMIRRGDCLYSAESLGLKSPFTTFGAFAPDADPRSLCNLNPQFND